jgi:hypothetical protein
VYCDRLCNNRLLTVTNELTGQSENNNVGLHFEPRPVFFLSLVFSARKKGQFSLLLQIPRVKRRPIYESVQVHGGKAPCILEQSWPLGTPAVLAQGKGPPVITE